MTFVTTLFRVAALCLLAGVAHAAPAPVAAADGSIPVPATVYSPALSYQAAALEPASPDRAWREQNRIVAGYNAMMLTMGGHAGHGTAAPDPHAGHTAMHGAVLAQTSAAPAAPAADPHAGHRMHAAPAASASSAKPGAASCCGNDGCCAGACCCKGDAAAGSQASLGGCCAKGSTGAPQSCAPARSGAGTASAPAAAHQHGGQP